MSLINHTCNTTLNLFQGIIDKVQNLNIQQILNQVQHNVLMIMFY